MSYWCYSLWRNLCYFSLCDYYCCCDCAPQGTLLRTASSGLKGVHHHVRDKDDDWGISRDEDGRLHVSPDNAHNLHRMYIPNPVPSATDSDNSPISPNVKEEPKSTSINNISRSESLSPKNISTQKHKNSHIRLASNDDEEENDTFLETEVTEITFGAQNREKDKSRTISTASATTAEDGWHQYRSVSVASNPSNNAKIGLIPPPSLSPAKGTPNGDFFDHSSSTSEFPTEKEVNGHASYLSSDKSLVEEESEILKELESALLVSHNN